MKTLNLTLPVHNESHVIEDSVEIVMRYLNTLDIAYEIHIVDNGSTDKTGLLANKLARDHINVNATVTSDPGRGGALKTSWLSSDADIQSYMDIDLSTDLMCFSELLAPILKGSADLSIGSRLLPESRVERSWRREYISRSYAFLSRAIANIPISDCQCGFKAITREAARHLIPLVLDNGWFFDTELLILAHRQGYRIYQHPVHWQEDSDSRVHIISTAIHDIKGLLRMRKSARKNEHKK